MDHAQIPVQRIVQTLRKLNAPSEPVFATNYGTKKLE